MKLINKTYVIDKPTFRLTLYYLGKFTIIAAIAFAILFIWVFRIPTATDEFNRETMNTILPISEIAVVCGLIMTCSYLVYIEKFIFDGNKKLFIYQKSSFFIKSQYVYGKYSDIDAITISYFFNWENVKNAVMTVILKNGKMVETDIYNMKLYSKEFINDDGKELADSIGCRFIPGIPGKKVVPIMDADRTIYYEYEPVKKRY